MGDAMYGMAILGLVLSQGFMQDALAADRSFAICSPDSPLIIEQSGLKLISVQGGGDSDETKMMEAVSDIMGESVLRVTNNSADEITVVIEFSGDEGFGVAEGAESSFTLPGWSSKVIPLRFSPSESPNSEEEFSVSHGYATLRLGDEDQDRNEDRDSSDKEQEDGAYFSEVYLTGFAVVIPEDQLDDLNPETDYEPEGETELEPELEEGDLPQQ